MADTDLDQDTVQKIVDRVPQGGYLTPQQIQAAQPPEPAPGQEMTPDQGIPVDRSRRAPSARRDPSPESTENLPIPQLRSTDLPNPQQYGLGPQQQQNPFQAFFSPMVLLGGLASLAARRPLMGAMSYATGALNGIQQGQQQVFDNNKAKFQEALRETIAQNQTDLNRYKAAWDTKEALDAEKFVKLWTAAHDNPTIQALMKSGNFRGAEAAILDLEKNNNAIVKAAEIQDAKDRMHDAYIDRLKHDPSVIAIAKAVRRYERPLPSMSRYNPYNQAVNELVTEQSDAEGKPYETTGYNARNTFVTGLAKDTAGSPGGKVLALKTATGHLGTLDRLVDNLQNGNTKALNQTYQDIQQQFGLAVAPTDFKAAMAIVANEVVKSIVPSGGTLEDRREAQAAFDRANSAPLLHSAINIVKELMGTQLENLSSQAEVAHASAEFDRYVPPEFRERLRINVGTGEVQRINDFRKRAEKEGYTKEQIDDFLAKKGH